MKKSFILYATLFLLAAMTACGNKDDKPGYKEQIVGKWNVQTYYHGIHDFNDENPWSTDGSYTQEETWNLPDTSYSGYDWAEFKADGTTCWHMNDHFAHECSHSDPNVNSEWLIKGDTLLINPSMPNTNGKFAIKELDSVTLIIEQYHKVSPYHEHHGWEETHRHTFKRVQ